MRTFRSSKNRWAGRLRAMSAGWVAAAMLAVMVGSAQAAAVTVTEGETATFQITVTQNTEAGFQYPDGRIRVYYASDGGTATPGHRRDGADYEPLNPGVNYVDGHTGEPLTISVKTYTDDQVEGDETFGMRVTGVYIPNVWWHSTALFYWTVTGLPTITITDATPAPAPQPTPAPPPINWSGCFWSSC